jgi:hypothetical protein
MKTSETAMALVDLMLDRLATARRIVEDGAEVGANL